jgi:hypothetical protein
MKSVGVNENTTEQFLSSSPYLMKQQMMTNAANMKAIFAEIGPFLFKEGLMRCEIDHKSITKETADSEKHGFGVVAVLQTEEIHERYMMAFIATDKTNTDTNEELLSKCFEVWLF